MTPTRAARPPRLRRIVAFALAGLLALGAGGAIALSDAPSAFALNPLTNDTAEGTPITHSPFLFQGTADPGDPVTVTSSGVSDPCNTVTDAFGNWSCNVVFTASTDLAVVTATRPDDGTPAQDSEGWEYPVALPVTVTENVPGAVLTNGAVISGAGAWPTATMVVTVNGSPCTPSGPAGPAGEWSCTYAGPPLADGDYPIVARQDVGAAISDPTNSVYRLDSTTVMPRSTAPYDSALAPVNIQTSDSTPTISGGAGTAEPGATVTVLASDFGNVPPAHPNGGPGFDVYCTAVATGAGAWSCSGAVLDVGQFWQIGFFAEDAAGNVTASPDDEFAIEILPPPDAPVIIHPVPGGGEITPFDISGTVDAVTTEVLVEVGGLDVCGGPVVPVANAFACNTIVLGGGPQTLDITAFDTYGTGTTTSLTVDSWGPTVVDTPLPGDTTSASTVRISGEAPVGSVLEVVVDVTPLASCNGVVTGIPEYDCMSGFLGVGAHSVHVRYLDGHGDYWPVVSRNVTIVPTLPAPVFTAPSVGYSSTDRSVHVAMTNAAEGTVYVREGLFNLCPPTPVAVASFSCDTSALSVGTHTITISQTDQYGVMSASAQRTVTILPPPVPKPLAMKVFGFAIQVLGEDGEPIGDAGVGTGDIVTIVASNVPPGTKIAAEIHSDPVALGGMTVGQTGQLLMRAVVPAVPPGPHDIVVGATAPGYFPGTVTSAIQVRGLKQLGQETTEIVKELGEPEDVKELGTPADGTGPAGAPDGGPGGVGGGGWGDPSEFGISVENPLDPASTSFSLSPAGIVLSGSIAILFLLLVGFPAELLESTIRSNYGRAFGWTARLRRRAGRMLAPVARVLAHPWWGTAITVGAAAFILGFADPDFGFTEASVRLFLAMVLAVAAINISLSLVVMRVAKRAFDVSAMLKPMPAALAIVALSVIASRAMGISPGFLFGVVLGVAYARELRLRDDARLGVLGVGLTIAAGLLAWLGYGIASATMSGQGFANNLVIEVLAAITLEALGTLIVALLPIEFLDGRTIFRWSKVAWAGLYGLTALVFLFVVVPLSDNWGTMSAPLFGWGTLFVVFAVVAVATWALFRRRRPVSSSSPAAAAPRRRARR